jgi:hypothetical protein
MKGFGNINNITKKKRFTASNARSKRIAQKVVVVGTVCG